MKKILLTVLCLASVATFSKGKTLTLTPKVYGGVQVLNIEKKDKKDKKDVYGNVGLGLDAKLNVFEKGKVTVLAGAGLRQDLLIDSKDKELKGQTSLNLLAGLEYELKDNLSLYGEANLAPGLIYGPIREKDVKPTIIPEVELGAKYNNFKLGVAIGGNIVLPTKETEGNNLFKVNLKVGYDIPTLKF